MKNKYIYILVLFFSIFASCTKDFEELNTDTKNPANVEPQFLFSAAQRQLCDYMNNSNVNFNITRLITQQWTQTTYIDESNYDLTTRNIGRNNWNFAYVQVLAQLNDSKKLIPDQNPTLFSDETKKNQEACVEIMNVLTFSQLVNTWGDIPYSEAFKDDINYPKYDDGLEIYKDLIKRLDAALALISTGHSGFGASDLYYGGDMNAWKKFGNSLKLKLGMMLSDVDSGLAKATVGSALSGGVFNNSGDDAKLVYSSSSPNTSPVWVDLVQSGRLDFVAGKTYVDVLATKHDPRLALYFGHDAANDYSGGIIGASNNYTLFSKPSSSVTDPSAPCYLLDYSEVEFYLAEAVERGFVTGNAKVHYDNAITNSILSWGGDLASAEIYLAQDQVSYDNAASGGSYKEKIGTQKWLSLYNRGWESWTEWRRLDFPVLEPAVDAESGIPLRLLYSDQESSLNTKNYDAVVKKIGSDDVETKLFWDKQ